MQVIRETVNAAGCVTSVFHPPPPQWLPPPAPCGVVWLWVALLWCGVVWLWVASPLPVVWCGSGVGFGGSPPSPPVAWCGLGGSPLQSPLSEVSTVT